MLRPSGDCQPQGDVCLQMLCREFGSLRGVVCDLHLMYLNGRLRKTSIGSATSAVADGMKTVDDQEI